MNTAAALMFLMKKIDALEDDDVIDLEETLLKLIWSQPDHPDRGEMLTKAVEIIECGK